MVQITINQQRIDVPEGMTVMQAADSAGIRIPRLCAHKALTPFGGCRLCVVEVEGMRVPMASCTLPVSEGMVVETETESLKKSRQFVLTMLFSERNHFCPFCQVSGGDCELQNAAYHEEMTHWPIQPGWNEFPVDTSHPYFVLDNNRCILCRRCVSACAEMAGNFTLSVADRGAKSMIVADTDIPLGESSCIKCGSCAQVCPTGALIDRFSAYQSHDRNLEETSSVCVGCSVGCAVKVMTRDNRLVRIEGDWDGAVNGGVLCELGRYIPLTESRPRLTTPLARKNGSLEPVSWDEALTLAQSRLQSGSLAALASTRLSVEALTAFKELFETKLAAQLTTTLEEGRATSATAKYAERVGNFEGRLDLLQTADVVLCVGADINRHHQVAGFLFKRNLNNGANLIVIDSAETTLAERARFVLAPKADATQTLILALQAVIAKEGLERKSLALADVESRVEKAVAECGVSAEALTQSARLLASAITPVILYGEADEATVEALHQLAVQIAATDEERNGILALKGGANSQAASLLGLERPFRLAGGETLYLALSDDALPQALADEIRKAEFVVAQASYESEVAEIADLVLPVGIWAEESGHFVNLDGRVQKAQKALDAPNEIPDNLNLLNQIAERMNITLNADWREAVRQRNVGAELRIL
ncbi:MAG: molybdopterin-dependent oxidoreductase [Anaerolineales bacterium]|nr:molybdopterin-dependent oxidoreductase [Anaerolineales bacterium]